MTTTEMATGLQATADAQAAGLRALADLIEANPALAATDSYIAGLSIWHTRDVATLAALARAGKAHGAEVRKAYGQQDDDQFALTLAWGAVRARALSYRSTVCERVVTGTEEVTREAPDPAALAAVPKVQVTETVETFEWRCTPIMAETGVQP